MHLADALPQPDARTWWGARRFRYNASLVVAGVLAFGAYLLAIDDCSAGGWGINVVLQGFGYLFMMGIANVCYYLGHYLRGSFVRET